MQTQTKPQGEILYPGNFLEDLARPLETIDRIKVFSELATYTPAKAMKGIVCANIDTTQRAMIVGRFLFLLQEQIKGKESLSTNELRVLGAEICHSFKRLTMEEIIYVLNEGKKQTFGKTYNRIDSPTVYGWFHAYRSDIDIQRLKRKQAQAESGHYSEGKNQPIDTTKAQHIESVYEKMKQKAKAEKEKQLRDQVEKEARLLTLDKDKQINTLIAHNKALEKQINILLYQLILLQK